jgi:Tol biopolymer transport system component
VDTKKFDMSSDTGRLGNVSDPQVTLDGSMIVYTRVQGDKRNLFTAPFKDRGRTSTQLTDSNMDYAPCWSPDGQWVLFTSQRDENEELYIIGLDGQNLTNLTNMPAADKDPAWQPPQP